ncbi:hypothetical protein [Stenotrophomonas oahuensis]|uniref:Uncharacterized protein n=1 Tax=Stenotrophomonas oahuensis TaxID=3003271 RepID=A0ABY9YMX3_9GAMM|nr:hypothetical protein [Stenotrophomonas sp. A5586]WNH51800.1 hypothetical protein PDM29_15835 [Stenotrophomonas sp. A5586]
MSPEFLPIDLDALKLASAAQQTSAEQGPMISLSKSSLDELMSIAGVTGYGLSGDRELVVYVVADSVIDNLPERLDGLKIRAEQTGTIKTLIGG